MPAPHVSDTLSAVSLSDESVTLPAANVSDGVEFEETFPEPQAEAGSAPAPVRSDAPAAPVAPRLSVAPAAPRLSVVRPEPAADVTETQFPAQLERRMREAEALVKQTIERVRLDEEKRLTEWMQARREEEERRLARWADERRVTIERTTDQRDARTDTAAPRVERRAVRDDVVTRLEEVLREWQERFEQRLDQRRDEDARMAERQRIRDEERLRAWRTELERALARQFSMGERAVAPAHAARSALADTFAAATSARDAGRVIHRAVGEVAKTTAFALALHQDGREDVAYRYRVTTDDEIGALLRGESLDDGPQSAAAHADDWVRAQRVVRTGTRNATVHTAQLAIRTGERTVGVLTLQTEGTPIAETALHRIAELEQVAGPRLAELRDAGSFRGA